MTDMVERVRVAIGDGHSSNCNVSPLVKSDKPCNCGAVERARAAIQALLEPTEEMITKAAAITDADRGDAIEDQIRSWCRSNYQAMLKTALGEE